MSDYAAFEAAYRDVYLALHRRDGPRQNLQAVSWAVLQHLALAGPLGVGELAQHLQRAQSVTSEIIAHLSADGYVEQEPDPADRRRHLVWLTPGGRGRLDDAHRVLDAPRVQNALEHHPDPTALIAGLAHLAAIAANREGEH